MAGSVYAFETVEDKEAKALKNEEKKLDLRKRKIDLEKEELEWELEKQKKALVANDAPVALEDGTYVAADDEYVYRGYTPYAHFITFAGVAPDQAEVEEMETKYREAYKKMHGRYPHTVYRRVELEDMDEFLDKEKAQANDAPAAAAGAAAGARRRRKRQ